VIFGLTGLAGGIPDDRLAGRVMIDSMGWFTDRFLALSKIRAHAVPPRWDRMGTDYLRNKK
jgi:hypothetical protein